MTEYEIITYVKSLEVVFDSKIEAKKYLELIRELDSESVHVLNPIEPTEMICDYDKLIEDVKSGYHVDSDGRNKRKDDTQIEDEVKEWLSVDDSPTTNYIEMFDGTNQCPECKSDLMHSGGCVSCLNCGFSKCD